MSENHEVPPVRHRRAQRPPEPFPGEVRSVPERDPASRSIETAPVQRHLAGISPAPYASQAPRRSAPGSAPASLVRAAADNPDRVHRSQPQRSSLQESREPDLPRQREENETKPVPRPLILLSLGLLLVCLLTFILTRFDMKELQDRIRARDEAYQNLLLQHPRGYESIIQENAGAFNLQPAFIRAIILCESSYHADAESSVGARGLMQLMESTARWIAGNMGDEAHSFDRLWDPAVNVRYGCWYLQYLSRLFDGDPILVTAAYHTGQGKVGSWLLDPEISPDGLRIELSNMPDGPTKSYVERVIHAYAVYDALYDHAFDPEPVVPAVLRSGL